MKQALRKELVEYGKKLRAIRCAIGLSSKEAAEVIGIDPANYCRIENGKVNFSFATLLLICDAFGWKVGFYIDVDDLSKYQEFLHDPMMQ